jgi:hypothetical protein
VSNETGSGGGGLYGPTAAVTVNVRPPTAAIPPSDRCLTATRTRDAETIAWCLYDAWRAGDRDAAYAVSWEHVVDTIFDWDQLDWELQDCVSDGIGHACSFDALPPGAERRSLFVLYIAPDIPDGDGFSYVYKIEKYE